MSIKHRHMAQHKHYNFIRLESSISKLCVLQLANLKQTDHKSKLKKKVVLIDQSYRR